MTAKGYVQVDTTNLTADVFANAGKALRNIAKSKPKCAEAIIELLNVVGVKVDDDYDPSVDVMSVWDVRAESKKLIARKDLSNLVLLYEGEDLEDAYDEEEIEEIIDTAATLDNWQNHRSDAVRDAYTAYLVHDRDQAYGLEDDEDDLDDDLEDEDEDNLDEE